MNVGDLKALLEFVDDNTQVYIAAENYMDIGEPGSRVDCGRATLEFIVDHTKIAAPEDSITNEIGLVLW